MLVDNRIKQVAFHGFCLIPRPPCLQFKLRVVVCVCLKIDTKYLKGEVFKILFMCFWRLVDLWFFTEIRLFNSFCSNLW